MEQPLFFVQNADRAVTSRDYKHLQPNQLRVHGQFRTIQGEGPWAGHVAHFVRLAGCNFGAKDPFCLFCDTSFQYDQGRDMTFDEILETATSQGPADLMVITGGEPSLQPTLPNLIEYLLNGPVVKAPRVIQIESNGTGLAVLDSCLANGAELVISPKASPQGYGRLKPLRSIFSPHEVTLKYVVEADPRSPHHLIPDDALDFANAAGRVYVSPMAVYKRAYTGEVSNAWDSTLIDHERTARNYSYAAELCLKHNLKLSIQQHLFCALA